MSRRSVLMATASTVTIGFASFLAAPVSAGDGGGIHPGVMTYTAGGQCTANFVFRDATSTYLGQAAHCSGTGQATDTNGCAAGSLPLGTPVEIDGATRSGTLIYNSWLAMQAVRETDEDACAYNDFALVRIDPVDVARVRATIPVLGGPSGTDSDGVAAGESVYSYGNSSLRAGISQLSAKEGISLGTAGNGWTHPVYTLTPGIPGDSGSPFVNSAGRALGVLSTLSIAPTPLSNNVSDLAKMLAYANGHGAPDVRLQNGSTPDVSTPILRGLLG